MVYDQTDQFNPPDQSIADWSTADQSTSQQVPPLGSTPQFQGGGSIPPPGLGGSTSPAQLPAPSPAPVAPNAKPLAPNVAFGGMNQTDSNLQLLLDKKTEAEQKGNQDTADLWGKAAKDYLDNQTVVQSMSGSFAEDRKVKEAKADAALAALSTQKIDPEHWYSTRSTAGNIFNALGVAFGGFSNGINKGGNPALDMINNAIKNDIASQKDNIGQKWQIFKAQNDLNDTVFNRQQFQLHYQEQYGFAALKAASLQANQIAAQSSLPDIKYKNAILQKQLSDEIAGRGLSLYAQQVAVGAASAAQVN